MQSVDSRIEEAERIVNAYGELLAQLEQTAYAHPSSCLPFTKDQIRQAIQTLLWELDEADEQIRNSLAQAYVFLAQFIPDAQVVTLERGQRAMNGEQPDDADLGYAEEAHRIMYHIKWEMEQALDDMRLFLH